MNRMKTTSGYSKITLAVIVLICVAAGMLRFNSHQVGAFSDDAHYIVLAESLADGQGFRLINFPDNPVESAFPPGWPVLLSPFTALFPGNYAVLKLLSFTFWAASLLLIYKLFARHISTPYLEILVAFIALNPGMIGFSGMVMSEMAYTFFSVLALYLFQQWDSYQNTKGKTKYWLFTSAVAAVALYTQSVRTVGVSILLTFVVHLLISRRYRLAGIATAVFFTGMLPQFILNRMNGGLFISSAYQSQVLRSSVTDRIIHMLANLQSYSDMMISGSLIPVFGPGTASLLHKFGIGAVLFPANVLILLLIATGIVLSIKQFRLIVLYAGFYFIALLNFWNPVVGSTQSRFLIPIVPFLWYFIMQTVQFLKKQTAAKLSRFISVFLAVLAFSIMLVSLTRSIQDWRNPIRNNITDLSIGTLWVSNNTPPETTVMTRDPVPDYLYTHRKTVAYPADGQDVEAYIEANAVDYIIVSPKLQMPRSNELEEYVVSQLLPVLTSDNSRFKSVYTDETHNVTVYECLRL